MKGIKKDIVFKAAADGELLAILRSELSNMPSGSVKSAMEHRLVSVDGVTTTKYNFPVNAGQEIKLSQAKNSSYSCPLEIIYEDAQLLAINKPAGLLAVPTETQTEHTAFTMLREAGVEPLFIVHRIDRDTSGVLLFAKSAEIREKLQSNWNEDKRREYFAICEGVFEEKSGRCDTLLRENSVHMVYSASYGEGQRAITNYEVLRENSMFSYLHVSIETGRKNQIRVHMKELGHPVVGDKKYGSKCNPLGRLGLHASLLELIHPVTGEVLTLKAPIDKRFKLPSDKTK